MSSIQDGPSGYRSQLNQTKPNHYKAGIVQYILLVFMAVSYTNREEIYSDQNSPFINSFTQTNIMVGDQFTFCWDYYHSDVPNIIKQLWQDQDFADVTLATKDNFQIRAHKFILSASSPIFRKILMENPHSNPLIYFNNLKSAEVNLLLKFIYLGQCEVGQDGLIAFLAAGKELVVKGLYEEKADVNYQHNAKEELSNSDKDVEIKNINLISDIEEIKVDQGPMKQEKDTPSNSHINDESFVSLLTNDKEINETSNEDISLNNGRSLFTMKNVKLSENLYNRVMLEHAKKNGEEFIPLDEAPENDLIKKLPIFLELAKKSDGDVYSSNSLKSLYNSIALYLVERQQPINLKTGAKFEHIRLVLKAMCARSVELGRGPGVRTVHEKYLPCDQCEHKSSSRHNLRYHKRNKHIPASNMQTEEVTNGDHLCTKCVYKAINVEALKSHMLYTHSGASFLCNKCDYKSGSPGNVKKHFESEHPDQTLPTNVTMVLPNQEAL